MKFSIRFARWAVASALAALAACGGGEVAQPSSAGSALKADVAAFTGHGVYWNPAEPGSGFFFEAQGSVGVVTFYMYETTGRAVWYSAAGSFAASGATGYRFEGELQRYTGGQSDSSTLSKAPTGTPIGRTVIDFDGFAAQVTLPGRSFAAQKFFQTGQGPAAGQPETGVYWIPSENGRGYTIEVRDNVATITVFHYTATGEPTWHLVTVPLRNGQPGQGDFTLYQGGQALTGPYQAPRSSSGGKMTATLDDACGGKIASPMAGGGLIRRFAFGSLPAGAECRTPASRAKDAWASAVHVPFTFQYEIGTTGEQAQQVPGLLASQGALGFRPHLASATDDSEQVYIRSAGNDRPTYTQLRPLASDSAEVNQIAGNGYRWVGGVAPEPDLVFFLRSATTANYEYRLEPRGTAMSTAGFLSLLDRMGGDGFRFAGIQSASSADASRFVFERNKNASPRFQYEQVAMPVNETALLAALNERGGRGFRFVGTRQPTSVPVADNALLFEKDTTQSVAGFTYFKRDIPQNVWERLAQLNTEGARGAILHSQTPLFGTVPVHLFYTVRQCNGPICEARRPVGDFLW